MSSLKKYFSYIIKPEHRNISVRQYVNHYLPLCFVALIVLISFMINNPSLYADTSTEIWPCFRHDAQHTGQSPYNGPQTNQLRWQIGSLENVVTSSPTIGSDGTVYIGYGDPNANESALYALVTDPNSDTKAKVKWSFPTGGIIISTPAIAQDGTIYFGCEDQNIYALNQDGTQKWCYPTGGAIHSSPVIGPDGTIYVGSLDGHLYAINPNGSKKWSYQTSEGILPSPAIRQKDGAIFFGSYNGIVYAIDPNGDFLGQYQTGAGVESSFAIGADGIAYVGSFDNNLYSFDPNGSTKIYQLGGEILSSPAIGNDGTVYIGCQDGRVYAIDTTVDPNVAIKWTFQTEDQVNSSPAIGADGTIYIGSKNKYVYALTPNGELKWGYQTGGPVETSPAIGADGTLYIASGDGKVYAFKDPVDQIWPCFRHDPQHTGQSPYNGPQTNQVKWRIGSLENAVTSSPTIGSDGTVYIGYGDPNGSALYALVNDPNSDTKAKVKWSFPTQGNIISTPAIAQDGTIYFGCQDYNIYALDPNGSLEWAYPTWSEVNSSPAIGPDGTIYVGSYDGNLYALNPDGSFKWNYPTSGYILSSPAIGKDGTIFIGSSDDSVYAIAPNGGLIAQYQTGGDVLSSFAIGADGTAYVGSYDNNLYSFDLEGNMKIHPLDGEIFSSPAIGEDGTLYIGCNDSKVYALDPAGPGDGIKWTFQTGDMVISSPAIGADGTIYIGSNDNKVYALTPNGELKWDYQTDGPVGTSPAIGVGVDGTLYIASGDGLVYAFGGPDVPPPCIFTADITATGQSITGHEDNICIVTIGIGTNGFTEEAPPTPPNNTVFLTLPGDELPLKKDIRAAETDPNKLLQEEWQLNVVVGISPGSVDPNKPGYFPVLSWDPDALCPPGEHTGYTELSLENEQGKRITLIPDMTQVCQYQTKKEDGDCGGKICSFTYYITWSTCVKVEMNFSAGWSMMSLPLELQNPTPSRLFPEAKVIYAYNKGMGYQRIGENQELEVGTGYWILFYESQSYEFCGKPIDSYSKTVNESGWEMIGGCTSGALPTADCCTMSVIYRYIKGVGYKLVQYKEPVKEELNPGEGFWILLKDVVDQCQITVEPTAPLSRFRACYVNN